MSEFLFTDEKKAKGIFDHAIRDVVREELLNAKKIVDRYHRKKKGLMDRILRVFEPTPPASLRHYFLDYHPQQKEFIERIEDLQDQARKGLPMDWTKAAEALRPMLLSMFVCGMGGEMEEAGQKNAWSDIFLSDFVIEFRKILEQDPLVIGQEKDHQINAFFLAVADEVIGLSDLVLGVKKLHEMNFSENKKSTDVDDNENFSAEIYLQTNEQRSELLFAAMNAGRKDLAESILFLMTQKKGLVTWAGSEDQSLSAMSLGFAPKDIDTMLDLFSSPQVLNISASDNMFVITCIQAARSMQLIALKTPPELIKKTVDTFDQLIERKGEDYGEFLSNILTAVTWKSKREGAHNYLFQFFEPVWTQLAHRHPECWLKLCEQPMLKDGTIGQEIMSWAMLNKALEGEQPSNIDLGKASCAKRISKM